MRRRRLLRVTGVSLAAGLAGCSSGSTDDTKLTPTGTVAETGTVDDTGAIQRNIRALWTAYNEEDADGVVATFHPDSPQDISADAITFRGTVTVDSITVTNITDGIATAEATVTVTDGSQTITESHEYELRRDEGTWEIWSFTTGESGATPTVTPAE